MRNAELIVGQPNRFERFWRQTPFTHGIAYRSKNRPQLARPIFGVVVIHCCAATSVSGILRFWALAYFITLVA
jgi:hypothetical protein